LIDLCVDATEAVAASAVRVVMVGPVEAIESAAPGIGRRSTPVELGEEAAPPVRRVRVGGVDGEHVDATADRDERRRLDADGGAGGRSAVREVAPVSARIVADAVERHV